MITPGIFFKNFKIKKKNLEVKKKFKNLIDENNQVIQSLSTSYKDNYNKNKLKIYQNNKLVRLIGMGGSTLGTQSIYNFLKHKIKKKFIFIDNLFPKVKIDNKQKFLNLVVSKSGNTIETIINSNIYIKKEDKNIFITENKKSYLHQLGTKLRAEVIHHNNFIGGRYSVLSEVGMLPAELMGLDSKKFRQLNNLIKNEKYLKHC